MKRFGLYLSLASATLFLGAHARGQETPPMMTPPAMSTIESGAARGGLRAAEVLKRFDKNGDGRIDEDERIDAREMMMTEQIERQLTRMAAAQAMPDEFRQRALELFDRNRDGRLDDEERAEAQKFVEDRAGMTTAPGLAAWREEFIRRVDRNSNGRIDPDERAALHDLLFGSAGVPMSSAEVKLDVRELESVLRAAIEAHPRQLQSFDLNGNRRLDDSEWTMARRQIVNVFHDEVASPRSEDVMAEVARQREIRANAPRQPLNAGERQRQLERVAEEVARRREARAKALEQLEAGK